VRIEVKMNENQTEWADIALSLVKSTAFWLFWLLFYIIGGFELTLVCLLLVIAQKTGQK
tara:strand:- start:1372 stop:1548 length:177 start_codon:yes stop_codon:yes gene_type:complete